MFLTNFSSDIFFRTLPRLHLRFVVTMRYRQLGSTDMVVSVLGLGGSMFGDVFGAVSQETQHDILHHALAAGINYIDTAPFYGIGKAETVLGEVNTTFLSLHVVSWLSNVGSIGCHTTNPSVVPLFYL